MSRPNVLAGMASIPEREESLLRAVASLIPQVDRVEVSLNGYDHVPPFLAENPRVHATIRPAGENGGDAEKFAGVDEWSGVVVTVDDDLLYPPDYVETLLAGLDRHGHDRIVGFHGGETRGFNGAARAASYRAIRCLGDLAHDDPTVNVLGTGALAFDTRRVPVFRDVFRSPNMADVYLASHAHAFGIPMVALAHRAGWLRDIQPPGPSIYDSNAQRDGSELDTSKAREREMGRHDWTTRPGRPRVRVSILTCDRPALLDDLLNDLDRDAGDVELELAVFEDASRADYTAVRERVERHGGSWWRSRRNYGKWRHHELVTRELGACRESEAEWFVFLPDDVRLVPHALVRAMETWSRLDDPATLTLWRLVDHEGMPNWTGRRPVDRGAAFEIFHVDGIYLARRELLGELGYRVPPISQARRGASSGVGRAMSINLHKRRRRMYRVSRSLALPVETVSVMNPHVADRPHEWQAL